MSDHEAFAGQLAEITKLITILATDQQKLLSEQAKTSNEQTKISSEQSKISNEQSKMASEQTKMSNDQSKLAMGQNQLTERLETVAYRHNTLSACVENLQIAKFPKSDVKSRTPEVAGGLDVPLGSSVDTTRGPSLGMGGGLPLPTPCKESADLLCPTSLTSHPSVKETTHNYADGTGVIGENENATIVPVFTVCEGSRNATALKRSTQMDRRWKRKEDSLGSPVDRVRPRTRSEIKCWRVPGTWLVFWLR